MKSQEAGACLSRVLPKTSRVHAVQLGNSKATGAEIASSTTLMMCLDSEPTTVRRLRKVHVDCLTGEIMGNTIVENSEWAPTEAIALQKRHTMNFFH